jgi:hypothetical protein
MSRKRSRSRVVCDELDLVEKFLGSHRHEAAKRLLESLQPEVNNLGWNWNARGVGLRYRQLFDRVLVESAKSCDCWTCGFTAEQKRMLIELTKQKAENLDCIEQSEHENNLTGAYAEVVFGMKFNLPINLRKGSDGGKDFSFSCAGVFSGVLTIDIKGTTYDQFRLPAVADLSGDADWNTRCQAGFTRMAYHHEEAFIRREGHIYVLIQVVDEHAHFLGFAFSNDVFEYHEKQFAGDQPGFAPKVLHTFEELLVLMPERMRITSNDEEARTPRL